jgi:hypothetical protein
MQISKHGIMFVGNDFGTKTSYDRLRGRGFENPPTWRHVKERCVRAGIVPKLTFFTNAVMGLRETGCALDKRNWSEYPEFTSFCRKFFLFQVEMVKPLLVVLLGPNSRATIESWQMGPILKQGVFPLVKIGNTELSLCHTTHPYGDFNFDEGRKNQDAIELRRAWETAQTVRATC